MAITNKFLRSRAQRPCIVFHKDVIAQYNESYLKRVQALIYVMKNYRSQKFVKPSKDEGSD